MADDASRTMREAHDRAQRALQEGCLPGCFYPPHPSGLEHREDCPNVPARESAWYAVHRHVSNGATAWRIVDDVLAVTNQRSKPAPTDTDALAPPRTYVAIEMPCTTCGAAPHALCRRRFPYSRGYACTPTGVQELGTTSGVHRSRVYDANRATMLSIDSAIQATWERAEDILRATAS